MLHYYYHHYYSYYYCYGAEASVVLYSAAISACEGSGAWEQALMKYNMI